MPDSPSSEDSAVTVIDVAQEEKTAEHLKKLNAARDKFVVTQHNLIQNAAKAAFKAAVLYATEQNINEDLISKILVYETYEAYVPVVEKLLKDFEEEFGEDTKINKYLGVWYKFFASMYQTKRLGMQAVREEVEAAKKGTHIIKPASPETVQAILNVLRSFDGRLITLSMWLKDGYMLKRLLKEDISKEEEEEARKEFFDEFKGFRIMSVEARITLLNCHLDTALDLKIKNYVNFLEGMEGVLNLLHEAREVSRDRFMKVHEETTFRFLLPLENKLPTMDSYISEKDRDKLKEVDPDQQLPTEQVVKIREHFIERFNKEKKGLEKTKYRPVPVGSQ